MIRILVVPDAHHPYVNASAWGCMLAAGRVFKPDVIVCLGDFGDFYTVSAHRKDVNLPSRLETEIDACNRALDQLDRLGAKRKHMVAGNHEDRLARYLADRAPAVSNLLKVEALFKLRDRGWSWTPYGKLLRVGKVFYAHDPSGAGKWAHERAGQDAGHPIVHGHTHRAAISYMGNIVGEKRFGLMAGWLGDEDRATYVGDARKRHDWMHAFAVGHMEPNGVTHVQLVPILNGRCVVDGKLVHA